MCMGNDAEADRVRKYPDPISLLTFKNKLYYENDQI